MIKSYYLVIFLLLLTPTLLIWQHFGMTRIIEISPRQPHGVRIADDHQDYGGDTVSSLGLTHDAFVMRCKLGPKTKYPYCKLQFLMGIAGKGVDLSQVDTIVLNIRYAGPTPRTVKLHVLNFEPDISTEADWTSQRYNEVAIGLDHQPTLAVPFKALRTADWWLSKYKVPLSNSYVRLENVTAVELSTGNEFSLGQWSTFELRAIAFHEKWISQTALLMYLVSAWIGFGIFGLLRVRTRTAELRQQTRYLRTLIDTLPMWVWLKDTGNQYLAVNHAKAAASGHSVGEMVGKADQELLRPELSAHFNDDAEVIATRRRISLEQAVPSANGLVWMETYRAPVLDEDGTLLGMVGVARDISDRKASEAAREAALAEAMALAHQRSNFLAQMSHELRTPLNAIMGYTQVLRRDGQPLTELQATGLATIQESSLHLLTLINDILDLARVEAGKMVLSATAAHLDGFLRGVVDIMRVKAEEKGLLFNFDLAPDLPVAVMIDETRLRQVLLNLLGNAVKFSDRGAVSLRVWAVPTTDRTACQGGETTTRLHFEVADSGIGMSEQQLSRLFQPFEQVADIPRRQDGTGLGLAISQQLVRLMGANIGVSSEPGKGSVFWFELAVPVATCSPAVLSARRTIVGYAGQSRRLLVVDDVVQNRAMLRDMLQALGFVVGCACDGVECLALLASFQPDLIVMDVMMPAMDGNETTRRIRQMPGWRTVPIIAVTASASREDEWACLEAGVDVFLAKPIDHDLLLDAIGAQLSLCWHTRPLPAEAHSAGDAGSANMVIPPAQEIETLWQLAQIGNMRTIAERANHVAALDAAYAPFAQRLRTMAHGYQSLALVAFLERHRTDSTVPQG